MTFASIKKKFGYGVLRDESLGQELSKAVKTKSRFDTAVASIITPLLVAIFEPWLEACFNKYSEAYFHTKMASGFNFIEDWKRNHRSTYGTLLGAIRPVSSRFDIDDEMLVNVIVDKLTARGWKVEEWEKNRFRSNIADFKAEFSS